MVELQKKSRVCLNLRSVKNLNIKVVDAMCGQGKTSWAIQYMNENKDKRFIFVTPFLNEVARIQDKCGFEVPSDDNKIRKIDDFKRLVDENKSIATTHKLLSHLTVEMVSMIKNSDYILILDEVIESVTESQLSDGDKKALIKLGLIKEVDGNLFRGDEDVIESFNEGSWAYSYIITGLKRKNLEIFEGKILMWLFPIDILNCFREIYILTFLFDGYPLSSYLKFNKLSYTKYSVCSNDDGYEIIDYVGTDTSKFKSLIALYEDEKINAIGNDVSSFSDYWWKNTARKNADILLELRKNIENVVKNRAKCKIDDVLWTVFKDYEGLVYNTRTKDKNFISHNLRATNNYAEKSTCIYLVNRNYNPIIKRWFKSKDIEVNNNYYKLGGAIQWIFRSRIRKDEPINLYIPSIAVRSLFISWLNGDLK